MVQADDVDGVRFRIGEVEVVIYATPIHLYTSRTYSGPLHLTLSKQSPPPLVSVHSAILEISPFNSVCIAIALLLRGSILSFYYSQVDGVERCVW